MKKIILSLAAAALVGACSSAPSGGQMNVTRDTNVVTGTAGANWSDQELRSNAFAAVCNQDETVADMRISRDSNGVATFSATCI